MLKWKTPYEILYNRKPSYDNLRVIGCLCFVLQPKGQRGKFEAKANKCVLLGYPTG